MGNPHFSPNLVVDLKLHLKKSIFEKRKITQAQKKYIYN